MEGPRPLHPPGFDIRASSAVPCFLLTATRLLCANCTSFSQRAAAAAAAAGDDNAACGSFVLARAVLPPSLLVPPPPPCRAPSWLAGGCCAELEGWSSTHCRGAAAQFARCHCVIGVVLPSDDPEMICLNRSLARSSSSSSTSSACSAVSCCCTHQSPLYAAADGTLTPSVCVCRCLTGHCVPGFPWRVMLRVWGVCVFAYARELAATPRPRARLRVAAVGFLADV